MRTLLSLIAAACICTPAFADNANVSTNPPAYPSGVNTQSMTPNGGLRVQPMDGAGHDASSSNPLPVTCITGCSGGGGGSVTVTGPLGNQAKSAAVSVVPATASTLAPAVVALSTAAGQVLATGTGFVSRVVCNDDASIIEYFGPNSVTNAGANGIKLSPGQCWDFSHNTAAIFGVSASATPNARVVQY